MVFAFNIPESVQATQDIYTEDLCSDRLNLIVLDAGDWYGQQHGQGYGGARQQYGGHVQQIVPQVGKYQQQQQQQGQLVRHGDHYHVQQHPEQQQRPRQDQRWYPGLDNNQIQDFYRGHGSRDF